ncbi:MAG: xanthine dehydrogenase family protein molybdopterin-binding subunit [Burkholderiales bacterium]|nr:xanthine dehydrogenase family protein molybdopterin-binding subunit [Burkholderiales bacterium]
MAAKANREAHGHHDPVGRVEDARLVTGNGKYAADWRLPGQLHARFVRADRAHADIVSIDATAALRHPGVKAVLTGEDAVQAGYFTAPNALNFPGRNGMTAIAPRRPALAHGRVRFVGEAVALVVAATPAAAQDAAELVAVEYRDRVPVTAPEAALAPGAPRIHDEVPGNCPFESEAGSAEAVAAAIAAAAHVTRLKVVSNRVAPSPMEPRACMVEWDASRDHYTLYVCSQGITTQRQQMSAWTGVKGSQFTIHARDVGGGFGQRTLAYPEYCALMIAAKKLGRPVQWVATRGEGFMADSHGRANVIEGELALDAGGRFLGLRLSWVNDMGSYLSPGAMGHIRNTTTCMTGVYRIPALYASYRVALTNTTPVAAYRGAGRPDIAYVVERLVSEAAAELGIDPAELRRRNFIPVEAFPYATPTGSTYEYADMPGLIEKALKLADWTGFAERRAKTEKNGKLRGLGIATVIENTGAGNAPKDDAEIEVGADGIVTVHTLAKAQGHGHETTFAQIVAGALELPLARVRVMQCAPEKQQSMVGNHTGGSRSTVGAGSVCHLAALKAIDEGKARAALVLGVEPSQVAYARGVFGSTESGKKVALADLARDGTPFAVAAEGRFGSTFPNGCHIAEVEVDPSTGATGITAYSAVDDCGRVINHAIVEGQLHGGVMQGIGQVLGESIVYDDATGQLLTGSFMDYCMPRAGWLRGISGQEHATPSKVSPLGVKGMGESGCTGSIPAVANAVMDALRSAGVGHVDMPLTPSRVWLALQSRQRKG